MANQLTATRVVTRVEGGQVAEALPQFRAARLGIVPDAVLIRNDGWTLGYRKADEAAARAMWAGDWIN